MNEEKIKEYYNKFNEEKRLTRRHGIVEYETTMKYIHKYLKEFQNPHILELGAGTGRYSIALSDKGYEVSALELVKHNLMTLKKHSNKVHSYLGNALDLSRFQDASFDMVLVFGPIYHLLTKEDKLKCLMEAKRVLKDGGYLFISYYMNEYAIIKHGFMEEKILSSIKEGRVNESFHVVSKEEDLYSMVRLEEIDEFQEALNLKRIQILSQDGASDYIRPYLNKLTEEEFQIYLQYHFSVCERKELLGASSHVLDILKKDI